MSAASIRFANVGVHYPNTDRDALQDITCTIQAGEFCVMVGPSGCGKSTLLRTVNRLIEPTRGTVYLDDGDIRSLDPYTLRRRIGYVIQAVGLFPHMTVARNIAVVPSLLGWDSKRIAARTRELLELVRLDPDRYASRLPRELSGGEQQRVGVARALAAYPDVLLMDEPFGALDAIVRRSLQDELLEVVRSAGTTVVFVTHDVDEALRLADRIVVLHDGRIEQAGAPLELLTAPATRYVDELLQASDSVRRLALISVSKAMQPDGVADAPQAIDASATLREALNYFLQGASRLRVIEGDKPAGSLTFDDLRSAISKR